MLIFVSNIVTSFMYVLTATNIDALSPFASDAVPSFVDYLCLVPLHFMVLICERSAILDLDVFLQFCVVCTFGDEGLVILSDPYAKFWRW
jgi:hypothetical protein